MSFSNLRRGDSVFIDANIFIYSFGGLSVECKEFLLKCAKREILGYTSTSLLAEILHRLMIAEAIEKGFVSPKNSLQQLKANPQCIRQLSKYNENVSKISEMNISILELVLSPHCYRLSLFTHCSLLISHCFHSSFPAVPLTTKDIKDNYELYIERFNKWLRK